MQATTPRVKQQHFPQRARLTGYLWRTSCGTTDILVCEVLHGCIGTCGDNCLGHPATQTPRNVRLTRKVKDGHKGSERVEKGRMGVGKGQKLL